MNALDWKRDLSVGTYVLRAATTSDAAGLAALMAEPEIEQWWHQDWDAARWADCLDRLIDDPNSLPLVVNGEDGGVAGYVEVYRVAGDVLGRHIQHGPTDLGMHIALGAASRGQGLGVDVMQAVLGAAGGIVAGCQRLVAEPDERNSKSIHAFAAAGFTPGQTLRLPDKTARLMEGDPNSVPVPAGRGSIPLRAGQNGVVL